MSFRAELTIEDKTYNVRRFYLVLDRQVDEKGRPSSMPGWKLIVRIDAVDDTTLVNWMIDPNKSLDGKIRLYKIDQDSRYKEIQFKKASCYVMHDSFKADISYATCEFEIIGEEILINSMVVLSSSYHMIELKSTINRNH
jgi:hypothetical protein